MVKSHTQTPNKHRMYTEDLEQMHVTSVSVSPYEWTLLSWFCEPYSSGVLNPSGFYISPFPGFL